MKRPSVTLTFKSKFARDWFIGQLTDGFGENECDAKWSGDALSIDVSHNEVFQHHQRLRKEHPEYFGNPAKAGVR